MIAVTNIGSALRTPTARRILRGCQRGNQDLIFLFEAALLLGLWEAPTRPASCRSRWKEHTNEKRPRLIESWGVPVEAHIPAYVMFSAEEMAPACHVAA
jgi:hypothetical protein